MYTSTFLRELYGLDLCIRQAVPQSLPVHLCFADDADLCMVLQIEGFGPWISNPSLVRDWRTLKVSLRFDATLCSCGRNHISRQESLLIEGSMNLFMTSTTENLLGLSSRADA